MQHGWNTEVKICVASVFHPWLNSPLYSLSTLYSTEPRGQVWFWQNGGSKQMKPALGNLAALVHGLQMKPVLRTPRQKCPPNGSGVRS